MITISKYMYMCMLGLLLLHYMKVGLTHCTRVVGEAYLSGCQKVTPHNPKVNYSLNRKGMSIHLLSSCFFTMCFSLFTMCFSVFTICSSSGSSAEVGKGCVVGMNFSYLGGGSLGTEHWNRIALLVCWCHPNIQSLLTL